MSEDARPIPVAYNGSGRLFGPAEEAEVLDVLRRGTLTRWGGTKVDALEEAWAARLGSKHAVAVSSGTAALHVALAAVDIEPGMEVITSPITDMGTVIAIVAAGLVPVFADVDPTTGLMAPDRAAERVSGRTAALLPVHLFGRVAPVRELAQLAADHGLVLLEDASQAHFSALGRTLAGTVGSAGCFSLQQSKVVSCGEGGIVVTDDDALAERMRLFQNKGWIRGAAGERAYPFAGLNYRMPELSAAVAGAQLRRADEIIMRRARSIAVVLRRTRGVAGLRVPAPGPDETVSWWALLAQFPEVDDLDRMIALAAGLAAAGLPFTLGYIGTAPLYLMEAMQRKKAQGHRRLPWSLASPEVSYRPGDCPAAEWFLRHSVTMNWNEGITTADAARIATALVAAVTAGSAGVGTVTGALPPELTG